MLGTEIDIFIPKQGWRDYSLEESQADKPYFSLTKKNEKLVNNNIRITALKQKPLYSNQNGHRADNKHCFVQFCYENRGYFYKR